MISDRTERWHSDLSGVDVATVTYHGDSPLVKNVRIHARQGTWKSALETDRHHPIKPENKGPHEMLTLEDFCFIYCDSVGVEVFWDDPAPYWGDIWTGD